VTRSGLREGVAPASRRPQVGFCRQAPGSPSTSSATPTRGTGAYMDEGSSRGNPHSVVEGMVIGAYAIGASEGVVYVRMESPSHREDPDRPGAAEEQGFLGNDIGLGLQLLHRHRLRFRRLRLREETA